jgi:YVTN family beta-propeller protein
MTALFTAETQRAQRPFLLCVLCVSVVIHSSAGSTANRDLSPEAIAASKDGATLYITEATARQLAVFDVRKNRVIRAIPLPGEPTGVAVSADGAGVYVTCDGDPGTVQIVNGAGLQPLKALAAGSGARSPVADPAGRFLYVCNRFGNTVSVLDLGARKEVAQIAVTRQPYAAALTPDGRTLFVAGLLPEGPATAEHVAARISVVDTASRKVERSIELPNGSASVRGAAMSPDGRRVYVSHIVGRFTVHTAQLEQGWMNTNAFSIIDVPGRKLLDTVLLDEADNGAANPWGIACTPDSRHLCVTHAGTHELSIIDLAGLAAKLGSGPGRAMDWATIWGRPYISEAVEDDLTVLAGVRTRIPLVGKGPRGIAVAAGAVFVAEYFSDSLGRVDLVRENAGSLPLGPRPQPDSRRLGEMQFHDATSCFQRWQSCSSCHPDARADGLNWDLLNDGIGNPKNTRSLLLAHRIPPAMSTGIRESAEKAVRAGMELIELMPPDEGIAATLDEYLKSLAARPSPWLESGKLSAAAERGRKLFFRAEVGCASCHRPPYYSDGELHDVGSHSAPDFAPDAAGNRVPQLQFKTPSLIEAWRTAPYFHDGRYAAIGEAIVQGNCGASRGGIRRLTPGQIKDLIQFVLSL